MTLRLLCAVLVDRAVRIIQTERVYPPQPTGILPDERIKGQVSCEGLVTPSIEILLRQARLRQDSQQLFPVHLAVQVRKQP